MGYLETMTPEEQRAEVRALIAFYDARGLNWIGIVGYHTAVFTGHWPLPKPGRRLRPPATPGEERR